MGILGLVLEEYAVTSVEFYHQSNHEAAQSSRRGEGRGVAGGVGNRLHLSEKQ